MGVLHTRYPTNLNFMDYQIRLWCAQILNLDWETMNLDLFLLATKNIFKNKSVSLMFIL